MNRRSILSALCTGALSLLAPVVAFATGRRRIEPVSLLRDDWLEWDSFDRRNQMNDASGTGRYIAALERLAVAAARIYNEGSVLSDAGRPTARFVRRNSREATLELEASLHDLRDNYPASVMLAYGRELPPVSDVSVLRALLAEARDTLSVIRAEVIDTYAESDEWPVRLQPPEWWNHYRRMADATLDRMKGDKRNA